MPLIPCLEEVVEEDAPYDRKEFYDLHHVFPMRKFSLSYQLKQLKTLNQIR